jgi:Cof subfamily protein (haloacid dehalogenase superfamily)
MDGTLLNSKDRVSDENKEALKYLQSKGIHVAIATGRIYTTARVYAKYLELVTPIICCNGAIVKNLKDDSIIYSNPISKENCFKLIDILRENNVYFHFYSEDTIFGERLEKKMLYFSEWGKTLKEEDRIKVEVVKDSKDIINRNETIYKFGFQSDDDKVLREIADKVSKKVDVEIHKSFSNMSDIMSIGVSKGSAIEKLANSLGVKREEIIAIGDNENDMSMIKYAGLGVVMENAEDKVKKVADYITSTNDENGVAEAIRKFIV